MLKFNQRKQKMMARAISASFLIQTCAFPAIHAFAADEVVAGATSSTTVATPSSEKNEQQKEPSINLKESPTNSFKDKSDSELWAALGITRDEYDKISMSDFKNYITKRHANDESYQNARKEKKDSYDLVMTEAETEMLNRKNNSFNWRAENSAHKVDGYFVEKKSDDGNTQFKVAGSAVKHAFENWDTLSDAQKDSVAMTAVQMGYKGKLTSDSDKFKAVDNLRKVIDAYSKDRTAANVYEAVTDFMKSNDIDFDKVLKDADNAQQQINQTSDDSKKTNGVEEKKKPCPSGYKFDEVNNICCLNDSTYDLGEGKCKKEIKAEDTCNKGYTFDSYSNKCCPNGSSYDLSKGACVIKGEEEKSEGSGRNKQLLGILAGLLLKGKAGGEAKNSDPDDPTGVQANKSGISKERAEYFMTVPFDFKFSYGGDSLESQRYFGEKDKENNIIVAGSDSKDRINITIRDRGSIERIESVIKAQVERYNKIAVKNNRPVITEMPRVHISLRVFNPEAIEKGVVNDNDRKWFAPYSVLKKEIQMATNAMAEYEIEQNKPEVVVPEGITRPAGNYIAFVVYHVPYFNDKSGKVSYQDRAFRVGYTVYKTNTTLAADKVSGDSREIRGVAQVEKDFGQVEATGVINTAEWNEANGYCKMTFSGKFSDAIQTTEGNNVSVRSKSISKDDCENSAGKSASFGKLTLSMDNSQMDGDKTLVDYDYDENNQPQSLGGAVTIGEKVVQDGASALDNEYAGVVNRGKRISATKIDVQNLDYINVNGMNLAYNSASREFYNYDGTPLSSNQKKDIAKNLGTTYYDEWNHIGADLSINDDGTFSLTRADGSVLVGSRTAEEEIGDLQKSTEAIRGSILQELAEDRTITAHNYTRADQYMNQQAGDYSHLFSNPQTKFQSDVIGVARETLGIGDNISDYLRYGLSTAFDVSGSVGAKTSRDEERESKSIHKKEDKNSSLKNEDLSLSTEASSNNSFKHVPRDPKETVLQAR